MTVVFAATAITATVLNSIAAQAPPTAANLTGTSWQLVKFQGSDDTTLTPDDRSKYTIEFGADGRLSARIDCNRGRGTWKTTGPSQLQLGPLALTRAMCPPGSLHDRIVKQWSAIRSYVLKDGHLFLSLMADGGIYEFEPVAGGTPAKPPAAAGRPLEKTYWKATLVGTTAVAAADPKREPHLVLEPGGKVAGSDGCNRLVGSYELTGETITFGRLAGTMMACPDTDATDRAFRQALEQARRWKIAGDSLELFDASGARLARFEGRDKQ
jgi:heat shock protein HslJ